MPLVSCGYPAGNETSQHACNALAKALFWLHILHLRVSAIQSSICLNIFLDPAGWAMSMFWAIQRICLEECCLINFTLCFLQHFSQYRKTDLADTAKIFKGNTVVSGRPQKGQHPENFKPLIIKKRNPNPMPQSFRIQEGTARLRYFWKSWYVWSDYGVCRSLDETNWVFLNILDPMTPFHRD